MFVWSDATLHPFKGYESDHNVFRIRNIKEQVEDDGTIACLGTFCWRNFSANFTSRYYPLSRALSDFSVVGETMAEGMGDNLEDVTVQFEVKVPEESGEDNVMAVVLDKNGNSFMMITLDYGLKRGIMPNRVYIYGRKLLLEKEREEIELTSGERSRLTIPEREWMVWAKEAQQVWDYWKSVGQ